MARGKVAELAAHIEDLYAILDWTEDELENEGMFVGVLKRAYTALQAKIKELEIDLAVAQNEIAILNMVLEEGVTLRDAYLEKYEDELDEQEETLRLWGDLLAAFERIHLDAMLKSGVSVYDLLTDSEKAIFDAVYQKDILFQWPDFSVTNGGNVTFSSSTTVSGSGQTVNVVLNGRSCLFDEETGTCPTCQEDREADQALAAELASDELRCMTCKEPHESWQECDIGNLLIRHASVAKKYGVGSSEEWDIRAGIEKLFHARGSEPEVSGKGGSDSCCTEKGKGCCSSRAHV